MGGLRAAARPRPQGAALLDILVVALLLADLSWSALSKPVRPEIEILAPLPGDKLALPVEVRFRLSCDGRAALSVDGFVAHTFVLSETTALEASLSLPNLSQERHVLAVDLLAADDTLLAQGPRWEIDVVDDSDLQAASELSAVANFDATVGWELEPVEPYDPEMSMEEREGAEELDGWLLVREHIEFTTLDPSDSCEDAGWATRSRPRRIWDTFQVFNELDVLELRLRELNSTVHRRVPLPRLCIRKIVNPFSSGPLSLRE